MLDVSFCGDSNVIGFNRQNIHITYQQQKMSYLPTTDKYAVNATLKRAIQIAQESNEDYGHVTYDLGIVRTVLPLQNNELNQFKSLFVQISDFHV